MLEQATEILGKSRPRCAESRPKSIGPSNRQTPASFPDPWVREVPRPADASVYTTISQTPIALTTSLLPQAVAAEVEEFFEGFVTEVGEQDIRLSTTSSGGEEGDAWLPKSRIPSSELEYLELGVPVRVSVVVRAEPRRERAYEVRFLRPHQWFRPTTEDAAPVVEYLLKKMNQALGNR